MGSVGWVGRAAGLVRPAVIEATAVSITSGGGVRPPRHPTLDGRRQGTVDWVSSAEADRKTRSGIWLIRHRLFKNG